MFNIGSTELMVIIVVALIFIGPSKLPELMRTFGKGMAEFRRMSSDVKHTFEAEVERAEQKKRQEEAKKELFPEDDEKAAVNTTAAESEMNSVDAKTEAEKQSVEASAENKTPETPISETATKA
ncbi:Sec-independent protein translocase protein TatB [Desulfovibrio inopinatus]|uniref:Sec-independent protein translocase protein TatB n=1 Tax=Desulfovibrio inopinatus TaxID=102109 RepID=UPI0004244AE4|nr:Sec-independent protein translocase protein TatB [Desulfovibrio inopinatus]